MRGQTEIIIILGIVIVAVMVGLYAFQVPLVPEPAGVGEMKNLLSENIRESLRAGTWDVMETIGYNGGYLNLDELPKGMVASYLGYDTAYWQYGQDSAVLSASEVEKEIKRGVQMAASSLAMTEFQGKTVSVGGVQNIVVTISDDKVNIKVWMPVSIEGYQIRQPIDYDMPISMGKIIKFASNLVEENRKNRNFEKITANAISMYQQQDEMDQPKVPSSGMLFGCGKFLHKGWFQVKPALEELIQGVYSNTYTAGKISHERVKESSYPSFVLPVYTDLDVMFYGPDELDKESFQMFPNPVTAASTPAPFTTICISPPYTVYYWLYYPIIVEVNDDKYLFRFALPLYVDMNEPGDWDDISVSLKQWKTNTERCKYSDCEANIKVVTPEGPAHGARVIYSGCDLGFTSADGTLSANVPCGIGEMQVYPMDISGDKTVAHSELTSSDELKNKIVNLLKKPFYQFHIKEVVFTNTSNVYAVKEVKENTEKNIMVAANPALGHMSTAALESNYASIDTIMPGLNDVNLLAVSGSGSDATARGGFQINFTFHENDTEYWMYVPTVQGGIDVAGMGQAKLTEVMKNCGILPIEVSPYSDTKLTGCRG